MKIAVPAHASSFFLSPRAFACALVFVPFAALAHGVGTPPPESLRLSRLARNCEAWIDKAAAEAVAFDSNSGAIFNTRLYLKVDPLQIPPQTIARVAFHGREFTWQGDALVGTSDFHDTELAPFDSAADYFVLDLGSLALQTWNLLSAGARRVSLEGAFVVETTDGQSLWLNENQRAFNNFTFDAGFEAWLKKEGQSIGSLGMAALPSLAQARKTADFAPSLNPESCR